MSDRSERSIQELYADDPERADALVFGRRSEKSRRGFLHGAGLAAMGAALGATIPFSRTMPSGLIPAALGQQAFDLRTIGKDGLTVMNDRPINLETPVHLLDPDITPVEQFFVRNNGLVPDMPSDPDTWELTIDGDVNSPLKITLGEMKKNFEAVTIQSQLECGGNGRAGFSPSPRGNQWTLGAVGNAQWRGIRLADLLKKAGVKPSAKYTGHYGADPHLSGDTSKPSISRGVPIEKAMDPHTLLVWEMNGKPLPLIHGAPLRLLAAGWVGSASTKWLNRVWVRDKEHDGPGMTGMSYRMPRDPVAPGAKVDPKDMEVITSMIVKSIITAPTTEAQVSAAQPIAVRGHAWAGDRAVKEMHVSIDYGATWMKAKLSPAPNRHAWQRWEASIKLPSKGYYEIWARATDDAGEMQPPVVPGWNPRGYMNNSQHRIAVIAA